MSNREITKQDLVNAVNSDGDLSHFSANDRRRLWQFALDHFQDEPVATPAPAKPGVR